MVWEKSPIFYYGSTTFAKNQRHFVSWKGRGKKVCPMSKLNVDVNGAIRVGNPKYITRG